MQPSSKFSKDFLFAKSNGSPPTTPYRAVSQDDAPAVPRLDSAVSLGLGSLHPFSLEVIKSPLKGWSPVPVHPPAPGYSKRLEDMWVVGVEAQIYLSRVSQKTVNCASYVTQERTVLPVSLSSVPPLPFLPHTPFVPPHAPFLCPCASNSFKDASLHPTPSRLAGPTLALRVTSSRKPISSCDLVPWVPFCCTCSESSLWRPSQKALSYSLCSDLPGCSLYMLMGEKGGRCPKRVRGTCGKQAKGF